MDLVTSELCSRLRGLSREQLLSLEPEELAHIEYVLREAKYERLDARCAKGIASFDEGPLYWLTTHTATENPHHKEQGLPFRGPFPKLKYFVPLFDAFTRHRRLFIPKTREMLTSWCVMGWAAHQAQWYKSEAIVQTDAEGKASELIDYVRQLWDNQDTPLRNRHPLTTKTTYEIAWSDGGRVLAIPKGEHKIRLYHPTIYIMDEASFLPEAQQCYDAAEPVTKQIIALSTAGPGWFGDECAR